MYGTYTRGFYQFITVCLCLCTMWASFVDYCSRFKVVYFSTLIQIVESVLNNLLKIDSKRDTAANKLFK